MRHIETVLKPVHLLIILGLALSIVGGISRTQSSQNAVDNGERELQGVAGVFALVWVLMVVACGVYFMNLRQLHNIARKVCLHHLCSKLNNMDVNGDSAGVVCCCGAAVSPYPHHLLSPQCYQSRY